MRRAQRMRTIWLLTTVYIKQLRYQLPKTNKPKTVAMKQDSEVKYTRYVYGNMLLTNDIK